MSEIKTVKNIFPNLPKRLAGLEELAENLWWSWHPSARMLYKRLDRQAWKESGHNPDKMLKELPKEFLDSAASNSDYLRHYDVVLSQFRKDTEQSGCRFLEGVRDPDIHTIAYFSAEYGLHHSVPFYAGGLGFLAGDHIKECSDLRIPLVAVGFMYPEGYVRQRIREDGWQENVGQHLDRDAASISRVLHRDGQQILVKVPFIEPPIHVAVWKVVVGQVYLYLLDTDIDMNDPWNRGISARLYTGDMEQRLRQEIVLGIGGSEVLDAMGIKHSVLHLNEGHAAFSLLERIRARVQKGMSYDSAGHDVFPFQLMEKYFHSYWPSLGLQREAFFELGIHPKEPGAGFNMTAFALRMSGYHNAVSRRHGEVARRMWQSLWPELAEDKVPIDYVTNGVHVPTWIEPKMELLFNKYLGLDWVEDHDNPLIWELIEEIPNEELWKTHYWLKIKLIDAMRERSRQPWTEDRASPSIVLSGGTLLDPSIFRRKRSSPFITEFLRTASPTAGSGS